METLSQEQVNKLVEVLKGDKDAIKFCLDLLWISHLWDDLIDKDRPRTDEDINKAFMTLITGPTDNPFFQKFQWNLTPLMTSAGFMWIDSNSLELDNKFMAFYIRNAIVNVIHHCIFLVGGRDWATEQGPDFWRVMCGDFEERYQEFLEE